MHIPVLVQEVIHYLDPRQNENFIDCTFGEGGHTAAILEKTGPRGKVLGVEADPELYKKLLARKIPGLIIVNDNFVNLKEIVKRTNFGPVAGILLDLGISSWHLKESGRGFSFLKDEPLDMRISTSAKVSTGDLTAKEIINHWPEGEIERILRDYSQERFARQIAKTICRARKIKPIETSLQLSEIVRKAVPRNYEEARIHPATRTFLALRIAVNKELENLAKALPQALEVIEKQGKIIVISFQSLEDKIVKDFFKNQEKQKTIKIITLKPITPVLTEIRNNPLSRSAKLRALVKI